MQNLQLNAKKRDPKMTPKGIRKAGQVPAVLYGRNVENQSLTVRDVEFEKVFRTAGESTIINLVTEDSKTHPVLVQDVQLHVLSHQPIHVDFYQVSMTEKLKANVVLEFTGEAPAVKTLGGVLFKQLSEVQVECLPADLPHNITIDISPLKTFEDVVLVKDLNVSDKVKILAPADEVVVKVQPPRDMEKELAPQTTDEKAAVEATVAATDADKAKAAAEKEAAKAEETK
jgi:large subunit ribosomal protein L25